MSSKTHIQSPQQTQTLDLDGRLERVGTWGNANSTMGYVFRPNSAEKVADIFALAKRENMSVGFRGGGNSYGDAATNEGGIILDLTRFKRILDYHPADGVIMVEPGLTLRELWEYVLGDGWWPPVCTGTMYITIGGGAAMNVHGKNSFKVGTLGDHITEFDLMLTNGEIITCNRSENSDIFHAAIGGFGMLGCFVSITLQLKRIYSGLLNVKVEASRNLAHMFEQFRVSEASNDYMVGWMDLTAKGKQLGRGEIHTAAYLASGEDPSPQQTQRIDQQHLNDTLFGIVPRSAMWRFMRPFFNELGVPYVNGAKYWAGRLSGGKTYQQPHAQFHFLLNYFPGWQKSAGTGGLIQYQPFVPKDSAESVFTHLIEKSHRRGVVPYLGVLKKHRHDPFLMTHGLDGYSLAVDYKITDKNRQSMVALCHELDDLIIGAGGRFYPAKDSVLRPESAESYLGADTIQQFRDLKNRCDPQTILQTNFWRRVFA